MTLNLSNDDLKTLVQCTNTLKKYGFDKDFFVLEGGKGMKAMDGDKIYTPDEVKIVNFYRFEGESDPGDMQILYAIETSDGTRGTLSDAFGTYASRRVSEFILKVHDIQKKTDRNKDYRQEDQEGGSKPNEEPLGSA
jgi:hypothetical protein